MKITRQEAQKKAINKKPQHRIQDYQMKTYEADGFLQQLSYNIVRPPRLQYNPSVALPKANQKHFSLEMHEIPFELALYLQERTEYVVLYSHGNSSNRAEACQLLNSLPKDVGLASFDFHACGNREEGFLTMGMNESKEINQAARFLKNLGYRVVGWGRSMGSVSLLLSDQCDVMVVDSPFSCLRDLCRESGAKLLPSYCCCILACCYPCAYCCIRSKVKEIAKFDMDQVDIVARVQQLNSNKSNKSICFLHANQDTLINSRHSLLLYNTFQGHKKLINFDGKHNGNRPLHVLNQSYQFIQKALSRINDHYQPTITNQKLNHMGTNFNDKHNLKPPAFNDMRKMHFPKSIDEDFAVQVTEEHK